MVNEIVGPSKTEGWCCEGVKDFVGVEIGAGSIIYEVVDGAVVIVHDVPYCAL